MMPARAPCSRAPPGQSPGLSPGVGDAVEDCVYEPVGAGDRPENPAQTFEKVESAPGRPLAPLQRGEVWA